MPNVGGVCPTADAEPGGGETGGSWPAGAQRLGGEGRERVEGGGGRDLTTIFVSSQFLRQHDTPDWLPSGLRTDQTVTFSPLAVFQDSNDSVGDSLLPSDDVTVCSGHTLESDSEQASSSEPQRRKDYRGHLRQRSVSDANLTSLHLSESQFATVTCFPLPTCAVDTMGF